MRDSPECLSKVFSKWLSVQKRWLAKEMACRVSYVDKFNFELKSNVKMRKLAKCWFISAATFLHRLGVLNNEKASDVITLYFHTFNTCN